MSSPISVGSLNRVVGDVGRLLVKVGGILILVLSLVDVLKYLGYLLIMHLAGGFLSSLFTLNPALAWISSLIGIAAVVGSVVFAVMIVLSIIFAYFGYRLYKVSDETFTRITRDRWMLIVAIMLAIAWLSGSIILVAFSVIAIIGLLLLPLQPATPPLTSASSKE
ncbi:MAG: hypothetical protein QXM02_07850 [Thermoproteota archaeon]|nr:hypothetical protein [Candidatus Brockarchaeota archaeon]